MVVQRATSATYHRNGFANALSGARETTIKTFEELPYALLGGLELEFGRESRFGKICRKCGIVSDSPRHAFVTNHMLA